MPLWIILLSDNFDVDYITEKKIKNWKLYIISDSTTNHVLSVPLLPGKKYIMVQVHRNTLPSIKLHLEFPFNWWKNEPSILVNSDTFHVTVLQYPFIQSIKGTQNIGIILGDF